VEIVRALRGGRRIARTTRAAAAFARDGPIEVGQDGGELAGVEFVCRDARELVEVYVEEERWRRREV
jgi:hypothetical protein